MKMCADKRSMAEAIMRTETVLINQKLQFITSKR